VSLLLRGLHWHAADGGGRGDIRISRGRIAAMGSGLRCLPEDRILPLRHHVALPGLINAHDHLGLDLFPRRGRPPYASFYGWARDVYRPQDELQREIMALPLQDRLWWGAYRNLIGGVTTVAHHDPYARSVFDRHFPVRVVRRCGWAHSLGFGRYVRWKAAWSRIQRRPFMIHAAEGIDEPSAREIDRLHAMGLLAPHTVLIHAVGVMPRHLDVIAAAGSAVVWCPASNQFLFGVTAPVSSLRRRGIPVALGTDSTLSGSPTLLTELRTARETGAASVEQLCEMATADAARILRLHDGRGILRAGGPADLVVFPDGAPTPAGALLEGVPSLVVIGGRVRLARKDLAEHLDLGPSACMLDGTPTWIYGDLEGLKRRIAARVRRETLEQNPIWRLLAGTSSIQEIPLRLATSP
jgi:cytosine/adenosine deaminase-related metal-dependent hydrolase